MSTDEWSSLLVTSALILALAGLGWALVQLLTRRAIHVAQITKYLSEGRRQQTITLVHILQWTAHIVIGAAAVLMLLSTFGVDITPLLASAGVAGLAVSLGAQTLIKDLIGGMFILVENQYTVGDAIQVGGVSGEVERLTLRTTHVRDVNGHLHIVPNGEVRVVANMTRDWSRALVDVSIGYEEDLDRVLSILQQLAEAFAHDDAFGPDLLERPEVVGPLTLTDWAITVRLQVKTQPGKQWAVARELQRRIHTTLAQAGIATPYPRQDVRVRHLKPPTTRTDSELKGREAT